MAAADERGSSILAGAGSSSPAGQTNVSSGAADGAGVAAAGDAGPAGGEADPGECRPNLVVVLTSHKTGTAQAG